MRLLQHFPFPEVRPEQRKIIADMEGSLSPAKTYLVLEVPTGGGKSALAKTLADAHGTTFVLTTTKQLQDQYARDFQDMALIKGRVNYPCALKPSVTVDVGLCLGNVQQLRACKQTRTCHYYNARFAAAEAKVALMSYHFFLYGCVSSTEGEWAPRDLAVLDEAHMLESVLVQYAEVRLAIAELNREYNLSLNLPPVNGDRPTLVTYLRRCAQQLRQKRDELYNGIKHTMQGTDAYHLSPDDVDTITTNNGRFYHLDRISKALDIALETIGNPRTWLLEADHEQVIVTPLSMQYLFERYVKPMARRFVFMSATFLDTQTFAMDLGGVREDTLMLRMESDFAAANSPIYVQPVGPMDRNHLTGTMPAIIAKVRELLAAHPKEKGIIHTTNYRIAKEIHAAIKGKRLLIKKERESNEQLLARHIKSKRPTVLLSPSLNVGVDLYGDLSRWQVIVKLPWLSLGDRRVAERYRTSPHWYTVEMWRSLLQAAGRSTRTIDDWSVTYVLDSSFTRCYHEFHAYLPKHFHQRLRFHKGGG